MKFILKVIIGTIVAVCTVWFLISLAVSYAARQNEVTLAQFDALRTGMSYLQVRSVMGSSGILADSHVVASSLSQKYVWLGAGSSSAAVTFVDNKVVGKFQPGLNAPAAVTYPLITRTLMEAVPPLRSPLASIWPADASLGFVLDLVLGVLAGSALGVVGAVVLGVPIGLIQGGLGRYRNPRP